MDLTNFLESFYSACCDGDWEHQYGIKIETLDNPGWSVAIDLLDTPLESRPFEPVTVERSEQDWIHCSVDSGCFRGHGGARNLAEILTRFRDWATANP